MIELKLFGGLSLGSSVFPLPSGVQQRRPLSLLALLALGGDRGISRERLQAYLWSESSSDRARHALDQLLYSVRRDLGHDVVLSSASELRLNPAAVRVDVWEFDRAVREKDWEQVVNRYGGPILDGSHLIDGAEFELWLDGVRNQREREYYHALEALARAASAQGERAAAVEWWRRRVNGDPLSAPAVLEFMRALASAGDRPGAVRHARMHQQMVRSVLEVEPDPAVEELVSVLAVPGVLPRNGAAADTRHVPDAQASPPGNEQFEPATTPATRPRSRAVRVFVPAGISLGVIALVMLARGQPVREAIANWGRGFTGTVDSPAPPKETTDLEARSLYLRARASWQTRTKEGLEHAVVLFRRATEHDPLHGAAHTGLAQSYAMLGYFGFSDAAAMYPKAKAAAQRAIALDVTSGEAYAALGQALAWEHSWAAAESAYLRALELAPNDATVHQWFALLLAYLGRVQEAVRQTREASRLDPLSVQINNMHGMMLFHAGYIDSALTQFERTVDEEPDSAWVWQNPWVLTNFGRVAAAAGRQTQAVRLIETALRAVPNHPRPLLDLAHVFVSAGDLSRARAAFARADSTHPHYPVYRALLHAMLDEYDEAFSRIRYVREWPLPALVQLNSERRFARFRSDPRFEEVRSRLRLNVTP